MLSRLVASILERIMRCFASFLRAFARVLQLQSVAEISLLASLLGIELVSVLTRVALKCLDPDS